MVFVKDISEGIVFSDEDKLKDQCAKNLLIDRMKFVRSFLQSWPHFALFSCCMFLKLASEYANSGQNVCLQ